MELGAFVGLAIALFFSLTTFRYEFRKDTLDINFLGVRMRSLEYSQIAGVSRGWKMARINQYLSGRFSMLWNEEVALTITLKSGAIRNVVITPDDPVGFLERLSERITRLPEGKEE